MKAVALVLSAVLASPVNFLIPQQSIQRAAKSIDTVFMYDAEGQLSGSGTAFAVSKSGLLTANHICEGARDGSLALKRNGVLIPLKIVRKNRGADACYLRGPHDLKPLSIRNKDVDEGESIWIYGSPLGIARVVTEGYSGPLVSISSGLRRQLSIMAYHGNSGSPVLDSEGQVVGILVQGIPDYPTISFASPHAAVRRLVGNQLH